MPKHYRECYRCNVVALEGKFERLSSNNPLPGDISAKCPGCGELVFLQICERYTERKVKAIKCEALLNVKVIE